MMVPEVEFASNPVQAEIAKLYLDEGFMRAYREKGHPQHKDALARMEALFKRRYPPEQQEG